MCVYERWDHGGVCVYEREGGRKGDRTREREYVCVQAQNCICMSEHGIMQAVFCLFPEFLSGKTGMHRLCVCI